MVIFFDGLVLSIVTIMVALGLGMLSSGHPGWWVFRNDYAAMAVEVTLTSAIVVGFITSAVACVEYGLPFLRWMAIYVAAVSLAIVAFNLAVRVTRGRRPGPAVT